MCQIQLRKLYSLHNTRLEYIYLTNQIANPTIGISKPFCIKIFIWEINCIDQYKIVKQGLDMHKKKQKSTWNIMLMYMKNEIIVNVL